MYNHSLLTRVLPYIYNEKQTTDPLLELLRSLNPTLIYDARYTSGTTILDQSGNGYDGQLVGATPVVDPSSPTGMSLMLDGIDDYVLAASPTLNLDAYSNFNYQSYSILTFARKNMLESNYQVMYCAALNSNCLVTTRIFSDDFWTSFSLSGEGAHGGGNDIPVTDWTMYTQTSSGVNGKMYINNIKFIDQSKPDSIFCDAYITFGVLYYDGSFSYYWNGNIALMVVFNYQLSDQNVTDIASVLGV